MNTHFNEGVDRSAHSLIGRFSNIQDLYALARDREPTARAQLAEVIGEILSEDLSHRESEIIADILTNLLRQFEIDLRFALSEQLAEMDTVPLRLILQLANDEINVARPVLMNSKVLGDLDLVYIIKSKPSEYWQVIAARAELGDDVIDILAETKDFETALALAKNEGIKLTENALGILSDMAQGSDVLATPLLERDEIGQDIATQLYKFVGEDIKHFIAQNYDIEVQKVSDAVDRTVTRVSQSDNRFVPEPYMIAAAETFKKQGILNTQMMVGTLRRGHIRSFIAQLSVFTGIEIDVVRDLLAQSNGQGLAIVAKAYGFEKHDFVSIFMLSSRIWNSGRLVDAQDIQAAMKYFTKASADVAMDIVKKKFL